MVSKKFFGVKMGFKRKIMLYSVHTKTFILYICCILLTRRLIMDDYKEALKELGLNGIEMAKLLRMDYGSYRSCLSRGGKKGTPRWVKAFMVAYNLKK